MRFVSFLAGFSGIIPNMKIKLIALCVALSSAQVYSATEWHVYSDTRDGLSGTQQLTNAFKRAQSGDTITIHTGTYNIIDIGEMMDPYFTSATQTEYTGAGTCYYSTVDNLTVQGDPACTPDQVVLSGRGDSTTKYGQRRPMHLGGNNCLVRNLTFAYGNGNFTRYINGVSKGYDYRRGGGLMMGKSTGVISNCVFYSCYTTQGAAAANGDYYRCTFDSTVSYPPLLWAKVIDGCTFVNGPGAISSPANGGYIKDCIFSNNTVISVSGYSGTISNCDFSGNYEMIADCTDVVNCRFLPNGSDMTGSTSADVTPARRCRLEGCTFKNFRIHWGSVVIDPLGMKNCLIFGNTMWGNGWSGLWNFTSDNTAGAEIINCTVVSNQSNGALSNFGTGKIVLKNVLCDGSTTGGQSVGYTDFWAADLSSVYFTNCIVKAANSSRKAETLNGNSENMLGKAVNPKFKGGTDHPYQLKRRSPYVGAGFVETWMETATDLAGNPRLRDGKVDIGCYQNWDPVPGMLLLLK